MNILALDTSTEVCSIALSYADQIIEQYELAPRQHANLILPMAQNLLTQAQLSLNQIDVIAFGRGPGSFTGLRIAASVTQALAFAHNIPVVALSSLQILAQGCYRQHNATHIIAALDASMNEIYCGEYHLHEQRMVLSNSERVCAPAEITIPSDGQWIGAGSGFDVYHQILQPKLADKLLQWLPNCYPSAQDMITLAAAEYQQGKAVSAEHALPVYLRDNVAKKHVLECFNRGKTEK